MAESHGQAHPSTSQSGSASNGCCGSAACEVPISVIPDRHDKAPVHTFKIHGLDCAEEVAVLKREIGPLVGGEDKLAFDVLNGRMMVLEGAAPVSAESIQRAVARTGMRALDSETAQSDLIRDRHAQVQFWFTAVSGIAILIGLALHVWLSGGFANAVRLFGRHDGHGMPSVEIVAYLLAIATGIRFVIVKAWYAAKSLRPDMNLLMVIAITGAIVLGEWFEAATVAFLFSLSLTLESWSVGRARRAISTLLDLAPTSVRIRDTDGMERQVPAAQVKVGTRFLVHPNERIPLDGEVVAGSSAVDQAPITGESVPINKEVGAGVYAGTINGHGALEIESRKAANNTTLARIIRMVEEAHGRRARAEQWVEKFARVYTPAVIVLALAVFLMPPLIIGASWSEWFYRALVLLVIGCPCALVISTPVSIVAALAAAARQGILIKGGTFIEQPAHLRAIAFDKTGTLTMGRPSVVAMVPLNGHTPVQLLERAAALEARSNHPLAQAIISHATAQGIAIQPADDVQSLAGKGVIGICEDERFWLGSHRYLLERGQDTPEISARAETLEREGHTVIAIGNERHVCGLLALSDTVRPEAADALNALRNNGIEHLVMLTGDNHVTAQIVAETLGIDEVHAELLPEDKVQRVAKLVEQYGAVAMIGDGVNDAPAMARASFGVAMGAAGSDAAIETADIALMTDDLGKLPLLRAHSRRTLVIIRQNIVFALAVKAAFVVLTFVGYATLWGAIAADVGASLLVVSNALRLLRSNHYP